jgi:hypothetical protein
MFHDDVVDVYAAKTRRDDIKNPNTYFIFFSLVCTLAMTHNRVIVVTIPIPFLKFVSSNPIGGDSGSDSR